MKILCISDQVDPLIYTNSVKERFYDVDIVLCAGDLPMEYIDFVVSSLNKPTYFIFGNHNLQEFKFYHEKDKFQCNDQYEMQHSHGATYAGFKMIRENNLLIAGVSGSIRYNDGINQYTDREMKIQLLKLVPALIYNKIRYGRYLDIFLTHASPKDIHDKPDPCHRGFECFRWFIKKFKPKYMVHGHIHLYDIQDIRVSKFEETTIVNAYSHFIIDTECPPKEDKKQNIKDNMSDIYTQKSEDDFYKARNKALFNDLQHFLVPDESKLLSFTEIKQMLKPQNEVYKGMDAVAVKDIVGSEGRYHDFDNHFFPRSAHLKNRWTSIDKAHLQNIILPPIVLYEISGLYFVRDGNHRVSVARAQGIEMIDAEIISLQSEIKLKPGMSKKQ